MKQPTGSVVNEYLDDIRAGKLKVMVVNYYYYSDSCEVYIWRYDRHVIERVIKQKQGN